MKKKAEKVIDFIMIVGGALIMILCIFAYFKPSRDLIPFDYVIITIALVWGYVLHIWGIVSQAIDIWQMRKNK